MINIGIQIGGKVLRNKGGKMYKVIRSVWGFNGKPLAYFSKLIGVKHRQVISNDIKK